MMGLHKICMQFKAGFYILPPSPLLATHTYAFELTPRATYVGYLKFSCHYHITYNVFKYLSKKCYQSN